MDDEFSIYKMTFILFVTIALDSVVLFFKNMKLFKVSSYAKLNCHHML
jgi:hypothetical protein